MIELKKFNNVLNFFRNHCLSAYPDINFIDFTEREKRFANIYYDIKRKATIHPSGKSQFVYMQRLVKTPRDLKHILRRTWRGWKSLHGEIDFDDLLVCNVIRYTSPEAFNFMIQNISALRNINPNEKDDIFKISSSTIKEQWNQEFKNSKWNQSAVFSLFAFLFPLLNDSYDGFNRSFKQRIIHEYPTDYFSRFLEEKIQNEDYRDQEILKLLGKVKENRFNARYRGKSLLTYIYEDKYFTQKFCDFGRIYIDSEDIRELVSKIFSKTLVLEKSRASAKSTNSFELLNYLSLDIGHNEYNYMEWLISEIKNSLPISVQYTKDIFNFWIYHDHDSSTIRDRNYIQLRKQVIGLAKEVYSSSTKLIRALNDTFPYSLTHFYRSISFKNDTKVIDDKEWRWLGNLLYRVLRTNRKAVFIHVVCLIFSEKTKYSSDGESRSFDYKSEVAVALFGNNLRNILKSISRGFQTNKKSTISKEFVDFAVMKSKELIKK